MIALRFMGKPRPYHLAPTVVKPSDLTSMDAFYARFKALSDARKTVDDAALAALAS